MKLEADEELDSSTVTELTSVCLYYMFVLETTFLNFGCVYFVP